MKCKCGQEMSGLVAWDDDQQTDVCFNLYCCNGNSGCGMIYKETPTALEGKRDLWIPPTLSFLDNVNEIDKWVKDYENGYIS